MDGQVWAQGPLEPKVLSAFYTYGTTLRSAYNNADIR